MEPSNNLQVETISRFRLAFLPGFHGATADTVSWLALFLAGADSI